MFRPALQLFRPVGAVVVAALIAVPVVVGTIVAPVPAAHADEVRAAQWHLRTLDVARAHETSRGSDVRVAVIDSGVDASHPDLEGNVAEGRDFVADTDGNVDTNGHGTGVAALIAAHGHGSGDGALGLAPRSTILPVRVSDDSGRYSSAGAARAIRWAADHGADVINVSGGSSTDDPRMRGAVGYAQSREAVIVASAGNTDQGDREVLYPAAYPGVIAVSAVDGDGDFSPESVEGPEVALAAPGVKVVTATAGRDYAFGVGTSDAAAIVSGTAALVRAEFPDLDAADVVNRLIRTADGKGPKGRDPRYGFGVVDPVAALTEDVPAASENPLGTVPLESSGQFDPPTSSATPPAVAERDGVSARWDFLLPWVVGAATVLLAGASVTAGWVMASRRRRLPRHW